MQGGLGLEAVYDEPVVSLKATSGLNSCPCGCRYQKSQDCLYFTSFARYQLVNAQSKRSDVTSYRLAVCLGPLHSHSYTHRSRATSTPTAPSPAPAQLIAMSEAGPERDAQIAELVNLTGLDAATVCRRSWKVLELLTKSVHRPNATSTHPTEILGSLQLSSSTSLLNSKTLLLSQTSTWLVPIQTPIPSRTLHHQRELAAVALSEARTFLLRRHRQQQHHHHHRRLGQPLVADSPHRGV